MALDFDDSFSFNGFGANADLLFAANGNTVYWQAGSQLRRGTISAGNLTVDNAFSFNGFGANVDRLFAANGNTVYWQAGNQLRRAFVIGANFTFDSAITNNQATTLLERHRFAFTQIMACTSLSNAQKTSLRSAYRKAISHAIDTDPRNNASANINGSQIWVNFANLFPRGQVEIAQTLIHEMMHCAGFTHPDRTVADQPFDNGPYYGTPPLLAEICIAGGQSLALATRMSQETCNGQNGKFSIHG